MTSSLSINTHRHGHTYRFIHIYTHTHTHRLQDISQSPWLWVFISFSFSFSSFIILSPLALSLSPPRSYSLLSFFCGLVVFHHLSIAPLFRFSFKLAAFLFLSPSLSYQPLLPLAPSPSLRLAVFIFQSFISTNVRQCFCPPSIDPQRERERERDGGREREKEVRKAEGKAAKQNEVEREIYGGRNGRYERERRSGSDKPGMRWEEGWKGRRMKSEKCGESLQYFNHSPRSLTQTDSGFPLHSSPTLSLATPLLLLLLTAQTSLHQLKYRY